MVTDGPVRREEGLQEADDDVPRRAEQAHGHHLLRRVHGPYAESLEELHERLRVGGQVGAAVSPFSPTQKCAGRNGRARSAGKPPSPDWMRSSWVPGARSSTGTQPSV